MAKPFSIQSPEDIAKEYAGNKQKIAQAMQMGIVDPTAGVLAGMFIDRMRAAQMQEQAPQTTVAQQVMGGAPPVPAPPLPAGGLGATAQAAPPMAPEMGMAPPMPDMGMAPPMPQEAPMGMADGGLAMLPVPDTMFDEPTNGGFNDGYAGGGIVAFSDGGATDIQREFDAAFPHSAPINPAAPMYYGYSLDPRQNMAIARELMGTPESKYSGMLEQDLLETFDPAAVEKRRKERTNDLLMDFGFRLAASRNPTLLGGIGEAGMGALPAAREAQRLDKAEQKYARKALADLEAGRNTQRAQLAAQALQMQQVAIQGYEAQTGREFTASQNQLNRDLEWRIATMKEAGDNARAAMRSSGGGGGGGGVAGTGKPMSTAQKVDLTGQYRSRAEDALKAMQQAEKGRDFAAFKAARDEYAQSVSGYNKLAGELNMPGMRSVVLSQFPRMNAELKARRARGEEPKTYRRPGSDAARVNRDTAVQDGRVITYEEAMRGAR